MSRDIVSLIQARLSSSRLPGKVLKPLGEATVLDQVCHRVAAFSRQIVVCTSVDASDDPVEAHCRDAGIPCVRGPLDDVFARFRQALADPAVERSEWFARVTADCPLISVALAEKAIGTIGDDLDYIGIDASSLPRGLAIELIRRDVFEAIEPASLDGPEREHVTLHLYENPERYHCRFIRPDEALLHPQFRLTLDYAEDYRLLRKLFADDERMTAEEAVERLREDPSLAAINAHCEQKAARP